MILSDLLFPRRCLGCGHSGSYFCQKCLSQIEIVQRFSCPQCHRPSQWGITHFSCQTPLALDGLISIFAYEGIFKKAIQKFKFRFVTDLSHEFTSLMYRFISLGFQEVFSQFDSSWILIPVPLHPWRQRQRGFNQSEILGKLLAEKMNWQFEPNLLIRSRFTQSQTLVKDKKKRQENVRHAFGLNPNSQFAIQDSKFILFDDVWTTGSTARECAKVLKRRGAKKVWTLTVAR